MKQLTRLRQIRRQLDKADTRRETLREERDRLILEVVRAYPFARGPRSSDADGVSQSDLAEAAGVSEAMVRKLVASAGSGKRGDSNRRHRS